MQIKRDAKTEPQPDLNQVGHSFQGQLPVPRTLNARYSTLNTYKDYLNYFDYFDCLDYLNYNYLNRQNLQNRMKLLVIALLHLERFFYIVINKLVIFTGDDAVADPV